MEFLDIYNLIDKKERDDRAKIISALYYLKAHQKPVLAKDITKTLQLHFGKLVPKNVNLALRRNSNYISVAGPGTPLRWKLLNSGIEFLEKLTKTKFETKNNSLEKFDYDIALISALEYPEFEAVIKACGGITFWKEIQDASFSHVYREAQITTAQGNKLRIVGVTSSSMGLTAAAIVTTQLIMRFRPKVIVMVGIAAGTYDGKKNFGDILVADPSVDYSSGKVVLSKGVREFLPDPYPISLNPRLRSLLQKYRGDNVLFDKIKMKWTGKSPEGSVRLHLGPLGAADQVIDDATRVLEIQKNWRKLIGVEMETYGVYRACHESPEPKPRFVSFKSVCDFAAEKTDSWQSYAAFTAAEFAIRFFEIEWEALWPTKN